MDNDILYHTGGGGSIEKIVLDKLMSNDDIVRKEGTWFNSKDMKHGILNRNCDVYYKDDDGMEKDNCVLLFGSPLWLCRLFSFWHPLYSVFSLWLYTDFSQIEKLMCDG